MVYSVWYKVCSVVCYVRHPLQYTSVPIVTLHPFPTALSPRTQRANSKPQHRQRAERKSQDRRGVKEPGVHYAGASGDSGGGGGLDEDIVTQEEVREGTEKRGGNPPSTSVCVCVCVCVCAGSSGNTYSYLTYALIVPPNFFLPSLPQVDQRTEALLHSLKPNLADKKQCRVVPINSR